MSEQVLENKLTTRIVLRNDSSAKWLASKSQVLLKGEVGIEFLDSGKVKMKVGDGVSTWEELSYFGGDECHVTEITIAAGGDHKTAIATELADATVNRGDIAIVKEAMIDAEDKDLVAGTVTQKYQYTAYVYGETADGESDWKAMDGNYSADSVYFDDDMLVTTPVGYVTLTNGQAYIPSKGKNLTQVFEAMYVKEANPSKTEPKASFSSVTSGAYEVGTKITPEYSVALSAGSYTYGPATGIVAKTWSVTDTRGTETLTTATGKFAELQVADDTNYYITATATHDGGPIPVTNKGNEYPAAQIASGSKIVTGANGTDTTTTNYENKRITGFRYHFYGAQTTPIEITGSAIRTAYIGKTANRGTSNNFSISVPADTTQVVIALKGRKLAKVEDSSAMNQDIASAFNLASSTLTIPGANEYAGVAYNVYVYTPETKLPEATYTVTTAAN